MTQHLHIALLLAAGLSACGTSGPNAPPADTPDAGAPDAERRSAAPSCEDGPGEVFERRIRPLLEQDRPSSCSKCHAAGVNLAAFVTGDACTSMACLVEQGMVDLEEPRESLLLQFIERGYEPAEDTGVTDVMVANEYTGFLEWIEWSAACEEQCPSGEGSLQCAAPDTPLLDPDEEEPEPPELPPLNLESYPCDIESQATAFRDWVFPDQSRCGHCHAENGAIAGVGDAPVWIDHSRSVRGAKRTMRNLYGLGAINLDNPDKSILLLKPLHEDAGGIEHGGGGKFRDKTDSLYVNMLQWLEMQQSCDLFRGEPHPSPTTDKLRETYPELPYGP